MGSDTVEDVGRGWGRRRGEWITGWLGPISSPVHLTQKRQERHLEGRRERGGGGLCIYYIGGTLGVAKIASSFENFIININTKTRSRIFSHNLGGAISIQKPEPKMAPFSPPMAPLSLSLFHSFCPLPLSLFLSPLSLFLSLDLSFTLSLSPSRAESRHRQRE